MKFNEIIPYLPLINCEVDDVKNQTFIPLRGIIPAARVLYLVYFDQGEYEH